MKSAMTRPGISRMVGLCLIMTSLFAVSFIAIHTGHNCCGDGCPVCLQIQWTRDSFRQLRHVPLRPGLPPDPMITRAAAPRDRSFDPLPITAVTLKVKLSA
ncbi:MAG: hypothetical protein LBU21_00815 [Treponema sp.]|nr:hypothetical protein [Treponema sp.]